MNGIQEVSGSIPLISTKKTAVTERWLLISFWWSRERTAGLLPDDLSAAPPTASVVGGSIPLISTKRISSHRKVAADFFLVGPGEDRWPLA